MRVQACGQGRGHKRVGGRRAWQRPRQQGRGGQHKSAIEVHEAISFGNEV